MEQFKKGDVVILKSGGPPMTIHDLGDFSLGCGVKNGALCVWFDGPRRQEGVFELESIEICGDDDYSQ